MPLLSPPCSRKERAATERMFSWFCALCSREYRMFKDYARALMSVKAKIDPANADRDRSDTVEQREGHAQRVFSLIEKSAPLISIAPTLFGGQVGFNYL